MDPRSDIIPFSYSPLQNSRKKSFLGQVAAETNETSNLAYTSW